MKSYLLLPIVLISMITFTTSLNINSMVLKSIEDQLDRKLKLHKLINKKEKQIAKGKKKKKTRKLKKKKSKTIEKKDKQDAKPGMKKIKRRLKEMEKELKQQKEKNKELNKVNMTLKKTKKSDRKLRKAVLRETVLKAFDNAKLDMATKKSLYQQLSSKNSFNHSPITKKDDKKAISRKLAKIIPKTLTMKDCISIVKRKLTVQQYEELKKSTKDMSIAKKKRRYLGLVDTITGFFDTVSDTLASLTQGVQELLDGDSAPAMGALAAGTFAVLKYKRTARLRKETKKISKVVDNNQFFSTLLRNINDKMSLCSSMLDSTLAKIESIDKNIGYRFEEKIEDFSTSPL